MARAHNYENYPGQDSAESSRLKQIALSFGRAAGRALSVFGSLPNNIPNPSAYIDIGRQAVQDEHTKLPVGRPVLLPATYNYESGMRSQPVYAGNVYDKKGESIIPLDLLWEHDMLVAAYTIDHGTRQRYLVVQKPPELHTGEAVIEEAVKFSEVYEHPQSEPRFVCKDTRESTVSDPELVRSLVIGGNYGAGSNLSMVLGLTPKHETREFSGDSTQDERSLAYSLYEIERALLEHEAKVNSRFI